MTHLHQLFSALLERGTQVPWMQSHEMQASQNDIQPNHHLLPTGPALQGTAQDLKNTWQAIYKQFTGPKSLQDNCLYILNNNPLCVRIQAQPNVPCGFNNFQEVLI